MQPAAAEAIAHWLAEQGLAGAREDTLLAAFCERCIAADLALDHALCFIDTLHPVYEGRAFRWRAEPSDEKSFVEYGRTDQGEGAESWRRTPFFPMLETGESELRRHIAGGAPADFAIVERLRTEGCTDLICFIHRFPGEGAIGVGVAPINWAMPT